MAREQLPGVGALPGVVEAQGPAEIDRLAIDPDAEVERERRRPGRASGAAAGAAAGRSFVAAVSPATAAPTTSAIAPTIESHAGARAHGRTVAGNTRVPRRHGMGAVTFLTDPRIAILRKVMATYRELLAQVKEEIAEVSTPEVRDRLDEADRPLLLDVREQDEWQEGHLPGAVHIPARQSRVTGRGSHPGHGRARS